jgi:hypothetical protein
MPSTVQILSGQADRGHLGRAVHSAVTRRRARRGGSSSERGGVR